MTARSLAGRASPVERCLVIGEPRLARADPREARGEPRPRRGHRRRCRSRRTTSSTSTVRRSAPASSPSCRWTAIDHRPDARTDAGGVGELIRIAKAAGVRVSVLPRMLEVVGSAVEFEDVDGMTMLGVRRVRAVALVAAAQARLRPGRHDDRPAGRGADHRRDRAGDPARLQRARSSSARCASAATAATSGSSSSARWSWTPTSRRTSCGRSTRSATACSRSADDPRVTRVGRVPAPHVARRAAAALQRPARRDEPRRARARSSSTRTPRCWASIAAACTSRPA